MKEQLSPYSDEQAYRIAYLIAGYIRKTLTVQEHDELDAWVEASDENMRLFEDLTDEAHIEDNLAWMENIPTEAALAKASQSVSFTRETTRNKKAVWPYLAAASVILLIATLFFLRSSDFEQKSTPFPIASNGDIAPGGNKATLTLSDGTVIDLAQTGKGLLRAESGTAIHKEEDGQISYSGNPSSHQTNNHILKTPKGGQYALTLSDGTKVWLNAESSLLFPPQFSGHTRVVQLVGEGYFEVAPNKALPFVVQLPNSTEIKVLGTHFNALSYPDETAQEITLVEGKIEVHHEKGKLVVNPREQALINGGVMTLRKHVDVDAIKGWKEGSFVFHDADIESIMRQVKRWYDVEVVFKTNTAEQFNATISRQEPISKLLRYLELTGKIHFKIENKTIYVLP